MYESDPAFSCFFLFVFLLIRGGSRMISEGIRFDRISVTLRIRTDRPEQTV